MPAEVRYRVAEAVLVSGTKESAWRITFVPVPPEGDRVVVTIASVVVEEMSFEDLYTREQIHRLTTARPPK